MTIKIKDQTVTKIIKAISRPVIFISIQEIKRYQKRQRSQK
jgi:hypothetical protein